MRLEMPACLPAWVASRGRGTRGLRRRSTCRVRRVHASSSSVSPKLFVVSGLPPPPRCCCWCSVTKLHNTETSLFFPWLRELIPTEALPPLSEFDREREGLVLIGKKIGQVCYVVTWSSEAKSNLPVCSDGRGRGDKEEDRPGLPSGIMVQRRKRSNGYSRASGGVGDVAGVFFMVQSWAAVRSVRLLSS